MELWTATLLKVYIIETQWKTCYSKLEKLLLLLQLRIYWLFLFINVCIVMKTQRDTRINSNVNMRSQHYPECLQTQYENNVI